MSSQIAPHRNREIEFILNGAKQFAVIEKGKDFASYIAAKTIKRVDIIIRYQNGGNGPEVVLTTDIQLLNEYNALLHDGVQRLGIKGYHRKMGYLFGYSPADIEVFIDSNIQCDCEKCTGNSANVTGV